LLEGLEVSEVNFSDLLITNDYLRLDSEYYSKTNKAVESKLQHFECKEIRTLAIVSDGDHSKFPDNQPQEIRYLQAKDIKNHFIENHNPVYVGKEYFTKNARSHIFEETIILSIMGSVGDIALIPKGFPPCIANRAVAIIKNINYVNPYYLFAFLSSRNGLQQIDKQKNGGVQERINLDLLGKIQIPILSNNFQNKVENMIKSAHSKREQSQSFYQQAVELLSKTIGLLNFKPSKKGTNIKSFKKSFLTTGRLDAEYYQPKYEQVENLIKKNGFVYLEDICSAINYGSVPTSPYTENNEGIPYIKGLNLKSTFIVKDKLDYIVNTEELPDKVFTKEGDIIISQMGTVGDVGVVTKDETGWIFASFTIRIRLKKNCGYLPRFIGLYIQNIAKEWYLQRNIAQASVRQNTDLPTIKKMYIPKVDINIQQQIVELIKKSFSLRAESERLLDEAKNMVEWEIEGRN